MSTPNATTVARAPARDDAESALTVVWAFVSGVGIVGSLCLYKATEQLISAPLTSWAPSLVMLTLASCRLRVQVPGHSATVSVSEVFIFASILLFGPGVAAWTVAFDGLVTSALQKPPRVYRTIFNTAEPAISIVLAGTVFFAVGGPVPVANPQLQSHGMFWPTVAMTTTYFLLNSLLQSVAISLESRVSTFEVWRSHALYIGMNYYAAASLAALAVQNSRMNLEVFGLVAPLLLLSYGAYRAAASRVADARRHVQEVEQLYQAAVETLAIAVDAKDQVTHGHIRRVQRHTVAVAKALGIRGDAELRALEAASLLHDIGKIAVPDYVLNKPGALSASEFEAIKLHAAKGAEILDVVTFPYPVVPIVRHHHEQWTGNGYPDGLAGEAIPLGARILSVVDCFDALTSDRQYRRKMTDDQAVAVVRSRSGTMYDPTVVEAFVALVPGLRVEDRAIDPAQSGSAPQALTTPHPEADGHADPVALLPSSIARTLSGFAPAAEACLFLRVEGTDVLRPAQATPRLLATVASIRLRVGEGLSGWIALNLHTIINSPADLDLGAAAGATGLRTCTAAPVFAFGSVAGVLAVYSSEPRGFSAFEVREIGVLAQRLGIRMVEEEASAALAPAVAS